MLKACYLLLVGFFCQQYLNAQNSIGLSDVINYSKSIYQAGAQNWDIGQDDKGVMYFANSEGLLTFDGTYWQLYQLPNKTVVRSVEIKGPRIYVGGQDEIGYFSAGKNGSLFYTSLKQLLPKSEQSFLDVWNIVCYGEDVFFRTSSKIMQLKAKTFAIYPNEDWRFMGTCNGRLIAEDHENRVLEFKANTWMPLIDRATLPTHSLITSAFSYTRDTAIITTQKNGAYYLVNNKLIAFTSAALSNIEKKSIYQARLLDSSHLLMGTSLGGCFILDAKGNVIQSFSTQQGLQNNNIRFAFTDRAKNIWLGLDNGIDFIPYNNAIKQINPDKENEGAGYAAIIHDHQLYLGTSNGLYSTQLSGNKNISLSKGSFKLVDNSQGQVWNLSEVNGRLLMGHHEGSFLIDHNRAIDFDQSTGFWNFFSMNGSSLPMMAAGNYKGVHFYNYENGQFNSVADAQFESSRIVAIENDHVWVAHPYKGIFKITPTGAGPIIKSYSVGTSRNTDNHYYVYRIKDRIIAPAGSGIFEYNSTTDKFEHATFFEKMFGNITPHYLKEDSEGNVWFVAEKSVGVLDFSAGQPKLIFIPELKGKIVSGFENIYPVNQHNILIGGEKGFYHIDYEQYRKKDPTLEVLLRSVKAGNDSDSLIYGGYGTETGNETDKLSYSWNSLHFEYSSTLYGQQSNIEYSYLLKGFDRDWSDWGKKTEKDYTNLPAGTYTFFVKARNNLGNESAVVGKRFTILPPWYKSWFAYFLYFVLAVCILYLLYKRQQKKFNRQKRKFELEQSRLQYLHQLEIDRNEKEIVKLRNEKLEAEIAYKNKELAGATMNLVQKGEVMSKIKDELTSLTKNVNGDESSKNLKKIIKMLTDDEKFEQDWEHFSFHFDRVHGNFLMALKTKWPNITPSELKLCAYLRMNLATKEIAQLMNISVRGVEVSRYRLRKKLQIPTEANLFDYLIESVKDVQEGIAT